MTLRILGLALFAAATVVAHPAPAQTGGTGPDTAVRLSPNVTVDSDTIRLGDLFHGSINEPDRVVGRSPAPGQRFTLSAAWLQDMARTAGVTWRPSGTFDRVVVYRPGQTVLGSEIMAAIKTQLETQGMPAAFRLKPTSTPAAMTIAATATRLIAVRESYFDPSTREFSAMVEVSAGDPEAQFVNVRGGAEAMVMVPVLNRNTVKNELITAEMVRVVEISDSEVGDDTVLDVDGIVGMSPRNFMRAGRPVRTSDIAKIELVSVPVLRRDMRRGEDVRDDDVAWVALNASTLPPNIVTDIESIVGKSPRQFQAAGKVITAGDLQDLRRVEVAVAARDVRRGAALSEDDFRWVEMPEADIAGNALQAPFDFTGMIATRSIRTGQVVRQPEVSAPKVVSKGKTVKVIYETGTIKLSALGTVMDDGGLGDTVRIVNAKSNTQMMAEVMSADQVRVSSIQTAMK